MFGYVVVNKPELKVKDLDVYQSFYCGLCRTLYHRYGRIAQTTLNFDMTFLAILLSGLYEPQEEVVPFRCGLHPTHKKMIKKNECLAYAADMTILLTYLKCEDNWQDERKVSSKAYERLLSKSYRKVKETYPKKIAKIEEVMRELSQLEKENVEDLDQMSSMFGKVMAEILCWKEDEWQSTLRHMGDYLGRFIYILDAYDDIEDDLKQEQYNPFRKDYAKDNFEERAHMILETMIAQAAIDFEKLPILEYSDILRNIVYSGIWSKYEMIRKKRLGDDDGSI